VFGHRFRFSADGPTMRWSCQRGCGAGGEKTYDGAADAARFSAAFDREHGSRSTAHVTPSIFPLWLARRLRSRRRA
jgi:hypothetical protein